MWTITITRLRRIMCSASWTRATRSRRRFSSKNENPQGRRQALQKNRHGKGEAPPFAPAPHAHLQGQEAQRQAAAGGAGERRGYAQNQENDSVLDVFGW